MIYKVLYSFRDHVSAFNVFHYITFRTGLAIMTALILGLIFGKPLIKRLQGWQIRQVVRDDTPPNHKKKTGTPTMGGILILGGLLAAVLFWSDLFNPYIQAVCLVVMGFGLVGFLDDRVKIRQGTGQGLRGWTRIFIEVVIAGAAVGIIFSQTSYSSVLYFPFLKKLHPDIGLWYLPFAIFVIVGCANAVNLTDGLDGLAIGPMLTSMLVYLLFAYAAGNAVISSYLGIPGVPGAGELAIFCGGMVGASLAFLWFNAYPAEIFMGDLGSLALGGGLGAVAVVAKQEIVLVLVGGIFVLETVSVICQVVSFKLVGRRIFRMAPIHHHFEMKGWAEPKIIVRFWIISAALALLALSTLKLR
ncbi:MAG: phospho-N-acetylmuramoyl-pentapeptide-transferase [Proteobacteria bacterium]|nr:phospho-N-acetylmuramoyl-pentapeptide-transferase [Pseudomonadota bacterium]